MTTPGGNDYTIKLIDLPCRIGGVCVLLSDGSFDVFINQRLPDAAQKKVLAHEMRHMDNGDLYDEITPVEEMERAASYQLKPV